MMKNKQPNKEFVEDLSNNYYEVTVDRVEGPGRSDAYEVTVESETGEEENYWIEDFDGNEDLARIKGETLERVEDSDLGALLKEQEGVEVEDRKGVVTINHTDPRRYE